MQNEFETVKYETVDEQPGTSWPHLALLILAFNTPLLVVLFTSLFILWETGG